MIIKVLMENTTKSSDYNVEHGLSLLIKTSSQNILFDTGASPKFIENASVMGEDLKDIDIVVISHGHYDHGGGLEEFLNINKRAKVYINRAAFGDFYALKDNGEMRYIGLNKILEDNDRVEFVDDYKMLNGVELFSGVEKKDPMPAGNKSLFVRKEKNIDNDDFCHEQNMILECEGKTILFAGCAHCGITNIMAAYKKIKKSAPDIVVGGFHLESPLTEQSQMIDIANQLNNRYTTYFTGHCTGDKAYKVMKTVLKENLQRLYTGLEIKIGDCISQKECEKARKARQLFKEGYNCCQSVFCSFLEEIDMDFNTALKLSSSFGGGMGRLREVCGAVSAMFMVAGLKYGYDDKEDIDKKAEHYRLIQSLAQDFKKRHNSIICRELLDLDEQISNPIPDKRDDKYYEKRPCDDLVASAADIINNLLKMEDQK